MKDDTHPTAADPNDVDNHPIIVTLDNGADISVARQALMTLPQLCEHILTTKVPKDSKPPRFTLYDSEDVVIEGINAIYAPNGKGLSFDNIVKHLGAKGIRALLYEGPHILQAAPALHLVVPFFEPISAVQLPDMAARLNGLLSGRLTADSFEPMTFSFYGGVGNQAINAKVIRGDFIDRRADLDIEAIHYNPDDDTEDSDNDVKRLNKLHAVLPIGGSTRVVTFGEMEDFPGRTTIIMTQKLSDFAALKNKYRHVYLDKEGNEQTVPMGKHWLGSNYRRQYDGGMAFMPLHNRPVVSSKIGAVLNLWHNFGVKPIKPEGKSGAAGCGLFLSFMFEIICGGNEQHFDYLRKREAWIFQKRMRSEIAVAMRTEEEGVGKGFYEWVVSHLLGNHAMTVANAKHVTGAFNPHLETLLRLTADEALFVGNHEHRNALFDLITNPKLNIEPKGCGLYQANNYLNISVLSNAKHFVPISGTARRFFIPTLSAEHMQDFAYFKAIEDQLRNEHGFEALLYHMLNEVNLEGFNVRDVPKTAGLAEQAALGRRGIDGLVEEACSYGRVPCEHWRWPGCTVTSGIESGYGFFVYIGKHHDKELSPFGAHRVIKRLVKEWGCRAKGQQRDAPGYGEQRISVLQWPSLEELRAKFVERFGAQDWLHPEATEWTASGKPPVFL